MTPINCQSCGYANEPTRVFCHQCGVRLDKPAVPVSVPVPAPAPVPVTPAPRTSRPNRSNLSTKKKPKVIFDPFSIVFSLVSTCVFAALLAAIILSLRSPENIPVIAEANAAQTADLQDRFNQATEPAPAPQSRFDQANNESSSVSEDQPDHVAAEPISTPRQFIATGAELNSLLASRVRIQQTGASSAVASEAQPFIALENQQFLLGMRVKVSLVEIISQRHYAVSGTPGQLNLKVVSSQIGSLPLPDLLSNLLMGWTKGVGDAFSHQLAKIQTAENVRIGTGNVQIVWKSEP